MRGPRQTKAKIHRNELCDRRVCISVELQAEDAFLEAKVLQHSDGDTHWV